MSPATSTKDAHQASPKASPKTSPVPTPKASPMASPAASSKATPDVFSSPMSKNPSHAGEPQDYMEAGESPGSDSSQTEVEGPSPPANKRLTWGDGEAPTKTASEKEGSLPEPNAKRISSASHKSGSEANNQAPLRTEKPSNEAQPQGSESDDTLAIEEFREASVPVPRYWLLCVSTCLGLFLSIVDTSIVATSIYTIGMHFEDMRTVNWVALAYTLTYLCFAVTFARVSDVIGRRKAFMSAYIIFFGFSLACGFSQSMQQLIAFRALQGIGGSGLYSLTLVILPELSPRHLKGHVSSIVGLVIACSGAAGPVLGGVLTEYATWRWVFWINGPIGAVSIAAFYLSWPRPEQLPTYPKRSWKEFDWVGTVLLIVSAVLMVFPFQNAGEKGSGTWSKAEFIAPLIIGVVCLFALIAWSLYAQHAYKRLMLAFPIDLFRNPRYTSSVIVTLLAGFPYLLIIYAFPIRLQVVSQEDALMAGVMLLPMLGTLAFGAAFNGILNKVKNWTAETLLAGAILMTLGCGLMVMVEGSEDDDMALGFLTFIGLGFGLVAGSASLFTLFECPISDYAPAQAIIAQVRILGGSFGIAASTALTDRRTEQYLSDLFTDEQLQSLGHGDSDQPITAEQAEGLNSAYTKAFQDGMIACVVIVAVSILVAASSIRPGKRRLVAELQDELVEKENKRRSMAVPAYDWEAEAEKRGWRLGGMGHRSHSGHGHGSGSGSSSETEAERAV